MKFSTFTASFALAGAAFASPLPVEKTARDGLAGAGLPQIPGLDQGLLGSLVEGVTSLIDGLGLGLLGGGLSQVTSIVPLKARDLDIAEIEVSTAEIQGVQSADGASYLNDGQAKQVVSGLKALTTTLQLGNLQSGQTPSLVGIPDELLSTLISAVTGLLGKLNLTSLAPGLVKRDDPLSELTDFSSLTSGIIKRDDPLSQLTSITGGLGLITKLAPELVQIINALSLGHLVPGIISVLNSIVNPK